MSKTLKIFTLTIGIALALFYLLSTIDYCYKTGGACNAGMLLIFLTPAISILTLLAEGSLIHLVYTKNIDKVKKLTMAGLVITGGLFLFNGFDKESLLFFSPLIGVNLYALVFSKWTEKA